MDVGGGRTDKAKKVISFRLKGSWKVVGWCHFCVSMVKHESFCEINFNEDEMSFGLNRLTLFVPKGLVVC